jgi:hypothetical protein
MTSHRFLLATSGILGLAAIGGWALALARGRDCAATIESLEARLHHGTVLDDTTGLLNRAGTTLLATRIVSISRRDSDAVCGCLVRILPSTGHPSNPAEDAIAVAEAAQVVFRSGDAVGRVAPDTILVVGKGPGFKTATVESRLLAQMVAMAAPGSPLPGVVVAVAVLHPWDEGGLPELEAKLADDLQVRLAVRGLADARPPAGWRGAD